MTVYLEPDDEITGAIARIRAVSGREAVIVVPPGSRIATSRINFKLLVREGNERKLNLAAVSDEPAIRALAISAGLPAYDSLAAAEQALATFREQDRRLAKRIGTDSTEAPSVASPSVASPPVAAPFVAAPRSKPHRPAGEGTAVMPIPAPERPLADAHVAEPGPRAGRRPRPRIGIAPLVVASLLVLLLAGVGYGAYLFLPTATITLQPLTTELRPAPFTVTADPNVAVADVAAGVVPAQWLEVPLTVSGTFSATGVDARETRATGFVRFRSENTLNVVAVPQGTVVATTDGIEFETTEQATIPRAEFGTSTPGTVDVPVRAVRPGPRGNVNADAINVVPPALSGQLVSANNPNATDGGRRLEESAVSQEDYDAALASLGSRLDAALDAKLADPATTPRGLTLFPETATVATPQPDQAATDIVGTVLPTFALAVDSVATVLAVNEGLVDELAEARVREGLAPAQDLVDDEVRTTRSAGRVVGQTIEYDVAPVALAYTEPDRTVIVAQLRGKSVADAQRILSAYGMVEISMWPEFVDRLPDQAARISLVVVPPSPRP